MLVIAHRGANKEALENSFEAFDLAIEGGSNRIELDVHLTKDGVPVVIHDEDLFRTCQTGGKVHDLALKELKEIHLKNGQKIPTLEETLDKYIARVEFNIEIKGDDRELTEKCCQIVSNFSKKEKIIFSSFDDIPLCHLRDKYPELKRAFLWGDLKFGFKSPFLKDPTLMMVKYDAHIFHPHAQLVDDEIMKKAHERNWKVFPWTSLKGVEDVEKKRIALWEKLKTLKVHGLCTNYPRELTKWNLNLGRK